MKNGIEAAAKFAESLDYADKNYTAEQVIRWLDGAEINGAGKFIFVEEDAKTAVYSGSKSTFYIVYDGDKLRRCGRMFAQDMIAADKGVHDGTTNEFHTRRGR
ncbi:MAG: hypothetical protein IJ685_12400 [Selenomonadaceae bacterium]|nr:hypothetical protein [Selenomonadaceae bacterium]